MSPVVPTSIAKVASVTPGVPVVPGRVYGSQNGEELAVLEAAWRWGIDGPLAGQFLLSKYRSQNSQHLK